MDLILVALAGLLLEKFLSGLQSLTIKEQRWEKS